MKLSPETPRARRETRFERQGASGHFRPALVALFAASGFAGLIYESVWTRYLKLFLGHAAYAQALVLAIFMGGMAIGSWIASRWSPGRRRLLLIYAAIEALIGTFGLFFHPLFTAVTTFAYDTVLPSLGGGAQIFKWSVSALLILPETVLLGMTFPLITAGTLRLVAEAPGRSIAMLYFANSLGAAVGVVVSGFWLVPVVGLPGAMRVAAGVNFAVAAAAWGLVRVRKVESDDRAVPARGAGHDGLSWFFLGVALVTGISSFIYEVTWIRMLTLVLGGSTHAFELMLSAFILGLALGGLFIHRRIDGLPDPPRTLAAVQVAMGVLAIATLPVYVHSFDLMQWLLEGIARTAGGYSVFNLVSNGIALAVMLPATFCAGMTLPLITLQLLRSGGGEQSIGAVYAANTVGAIAGVFFAIHLGLPQFGLKALLVAGGALDIAVGVALFGRLPAGRLLAGTALALAALALAFVQLDPYRTASGVYRTARILDRSASRVIYQRDGKTATVSVVEHEEGSVLDIATNGKVDAAVRMPLDEPPTPDEPMMVLLGAIPMSLHPAARYVACIGFGAGITTHILLQNPDFLRVDTVEIEPEMLRAARLFRPRNELAFTDPRSHIFIDDAKAFFAMQGHDYDLIVSEPSNPWVSGVAGLFTDEFYRLVHRHMAPGAVFAQWIQLYEIDLPHVVSVLKAVEANFQDYAVYAPTNVDLIIVASTGRRISLPDPAILGMPGIAVSLSRIGVAGLQDLEIRRAGTRTSWDGLTRMFTIPASSDYLPVLDDGAARALFLRSDASSLVGFQRRVFPAVEMLSGLAPQEKVTHVSPTSFFVGSRLALEAMWLRDALLGKAGFAEKFVASDDLHEHAGILAGWLRRCSGRPLPLRSVLRVAVSILAQLTPEELGSIWQAIHRCESSVSIRDGRWLAVLEAVGRRDAAQAAALSRAVLEAEPQLDAASKRFLVTAGMIGSLADADVAGARELWVKHGGPIRLADDLLLRVLVARAASDEDGAHLAAP